ncbi:hypothetical protein Q7P36_009176 [Cladosporium allicinum]
MPSQSSNSNGGYSVTSSGTNSQVRVHNTAAVQLQYRTLQTHSPYLNNRPPTKPITNLDQKKNQGNSYDSRDYGSSASNQNSYHYSNSDGSYYYYSNPNAAPGTATTPLLSLLPVAMEASKEPSRDAEEG